MEVTDFFLVLFLILIYALQSLFTKCFSAKYPGKAENSSAVFTVVSGFTVALVTSVVIGFQFELSLLTFILGLLNAAALFVYNTSFIKACTLGPFSVTMVFSIAGGIIIPTVTAATLPLIIKSMGAPVLPSSVKLISVAVVLAATYLVSRKAGESFNKKGLYFLCALGVGVTNGIYGSLLDAQQKLTGIQEKEEMAIISYLFAAIFSTAVILVKEKRRFPDAFRQSRISLVHLLLGSAMITVAINLLGILLSIVNVTVLYTMNNAGVFVFSVLFSRFLFKEKLTLINVIGIIIVCIGLVGVAF